MTKKLSDAPCDKCGYNGPNYYQPSTHKCAEPPAPLPDEVESAFGVICNVMDGPIIDAVDTIRAHISALEIQQVNNPEYQKWLDIKRKFGQWKNYLADSISPECLAPLQLSTMLYEFNHGTFDFSPIKIKNLMKTSAFAYKLEAENKRLREAVIFRDRAIMSLRDFGETVAGSSSYWTEIWPNLEAAIAQSDGKAGE